MAKKKSSAEIAADVRRIIVRIERDYGTVPYGALDDKVINLTNQIEYLLRSGTTDDRIIDIVVAALPVKPESMKVPPLENIGSLITYEDENGADRCLGHLFYTQEHGTYEPTFGKVDVSKEDTDTHNRLLDEAMIKGLDENCEIGQRGTFYYAESGNDILIHTWTGIPVATAKPTYKGQFRFDRNSKKFRATLANDSTVVTIERIA